MDGSQGRADEVGKAMIRDILVPMTFTVGDDAALDAALRIAERTGARVAALITTEVPTSLPVDWTAFSAEVYAGMYEDASRRSQALAERLRIRLASADASAEIRRVEGMLQRASRTGALHAVHADLSVTSRAANAASRANAQAMFSDLLVASGRPVLLVPASGPVELPPRRACVAWQPTREASRAVHDAMPLLQSAEAVDVLVVDPDVSGGQHGAEPGADIAAHLAHHGLRVNVVQRPSMGLSVASAILRHAAEQGAELLVAGGYSHSRLREQVLGGVTQELFETAELPVLFSH